MLQTKRKNGKYIVGLKERKEVRSGRRKAIAIGLEAHTNRS